MSQGDYTLRDVVNELLIPRLDRQDRRIDNKADEEDLKQIARELQSLKAQTLDTDDIKRIFAEAVKESSTRGWTTAQRWIGIITIVVILGGFFLNLYIAISTPRR